MTKLVCMFSGWMECDVEDVLLTCPQTNVTKTAAVWLKEKGNIDDLILNNLRDMVTMSTDGEFEQIELSIEREGVNE